VSKLVLLVDDDPIFLDATAAVVETRYRVVTASNGTEALAAIAQAPPDVAVLDVMMDHLSEGFDVARAIRAGAATKHTKILMLTGVDEVYNLRIEVDEATLPYDRFLQKPVAPERLLATIGELLA
jgi:two-component system cell cycle response regulator